MTTDNTQELDDRQHIKFNILVPFLAAITIKRQREKGNRIKDTETAYYDFAVDLIIDWHNKQTLELLDRLESELNEQKKAAEDNLAYHTENTKNERLIGDWQGTVYGIEFCRPAIEAERKRLLTS